MPESDRNADEVDRCHCWWHKDFRPPAAGRSDKMWRLLLALSPVDDDDRMSDGDGTAR